MVGAVGIGHPRQRPRRFADRVDPSPTSLNTITGFAVSLRVSCFCSGRLNRFLDGFGGGLPTTNV